MTGLQMRLLRTRQRSLVAGRHQHGLPRDAAATHTFAA